MDTKAGPVTLSDYRAEARRILREELLGGEIPARFDPLPMALVLLARERPECAARTVLGHGDAPIAPDPDPRRRLAAAFAVTVLRLERIGTVEHRISRGRVLDVVWRALLQVKTRACGWEEPARVAV